MGALVNQILFGLIAAFLLGCGLGVLAARRVYRNRADTPIRDSDRFTDKTEERP